MAVLAVNHIGPDRNILTTAGWIVIKIHTDVCPTVYTIMMAIVIPFHPRHQQVKVVVYLVKYQN